MKSPLRCGILLALVILHSSAMRASAADVKFERVVLDDRFIAYERDVGDIDGDGDKDVVAVQEGDTTIEVFRAPAWERSTIIRFSGTERFPRADDLKVADMDGDGDLDVVTRLGTGPASDAQGIAVWCENLGGGSRFATHPIGTSPEYVKDIVIADFDRDKKPDVAMRMDSQTQIWLQGEGGWNEVMLRHPPHEGMEAGDIDGDGDPDLILNGFWFATPDSPKSARVAGNYVRRVIDASWYNQTGDWTSNSCKVVVGDFDGDGNLDAAFSHSERAGYPVAWYRSTTPLVDDSWTKRTVASVDYCHTLQAADWDLDGDVDLVAGGMIQSRQRGLRFLCNDGNGAAWTTQVIQGDGSYSAETGDIDSDGDPDIVGIRNWNSAPTYIYRNLVHDNLKTDQWTYKQISDKHSRTFGLCFADVDHDGDRDIASGAFLYLNPGPDTKGEWHQVRVAEGIHVFASLDVDDDQLADLIALRDNPSQNRIDLFWVEAKNSQGAEWSLSRLIGDVPRGDHPEGFQGYRVVQLVPGEKPEFVVSTMHGIYYFNVPRNPRHDVWNRTLVTTNDSDEGIGTADIDGDGQLDITFTSGKEKLVRWAKNPGGGRENWTVFTIGAFPEADWPDRCEAADLNGDGRVDVVVTEENRGVTGDALACWWEQPSAEKAEGGWTRHTIATQFTMNSLDLTDVDRDGDVDVILAEHRGPRRIAVWSNDGRGRFHEQLIGQGHESHLGARVVDLDGDGGLDLVSIAYDDFAKVHLWRSSSVPDRKRNLRR